ncbi:MAG: transposase [Clostridia bacterium]|nr:transposase [Clostridia bacterium]
MAQYQIVADSEILQQSFMRGQGLAHLVKEILNQVLEGQATEQVGTKPYERTEERKGYSNGHSRKAA